MCYREIKDINDCEILQRNINRLGEWAVSNGMRFQPAKCNIMRLSRKQNNIDFKYTLKGTTELEQLVSIKYLGVNITSNLHWGKHVDAICDNSYKILGLLRRNLSSCPREVKMLAYKGLIRPILEYARAAWDQKLPQEKLVKFQNQAARFIASDCSCDPGSMTKILLDLKLRASQRKKKKQQTNLILQRSEPPSCYSNRHNAKTKEADKKHARRALHQHSSKNR